MKKIFKNTNLLLCLILFSGNVYSQAIKFTFLGVNSPVKDDGDYNTPIYFGVGYEHNIHERLSLSLEYTIPFDGIMVLEDFSRTNSVSGYNVAFYYGMAASASELMYTSKFFFSDNDDGSTFISSGISLQMLKYKWEINDIHAADFSGTYNLPPGLRAGTFEETKISLPLTFLLGYRGSMDGFFGDYGIGIKANFMGKNLPSNSTLKYIDAPTAKTIGFVFYMNWGIGWAD